MSTISLLQQNYTRVKEIDRQMEDLNYESFLFRNLKRKRLRLEREKIIAVNEKLALTHLEETNETYQLLMRRNYELLKKDRLEFKVYAEEYIHMSTYTTAMSGSIHHNGYAYCQASGSNVSIIRIFDRYKFPKNLEGRVNYWGIIKLKTVKTDMAWWSTIPKRLTGFVNDEGIIKITTQERDVEFFSNGQVCMSKMIANFFGDNDEVKEEFFDNCQKMKDMIAELAASIQYNNDQNL